MRKIVLLFMVMLIGGCGDKSDAEANLKCPHSLDIKTGSDFDFEQALPYCEKAAKAGSMQAQLKLGYMYLYGKALKQDKKRAVEWLYKAADNGSLEAKAVLIPISRNDVNVSYVCQVGEERLFSQYAVNNSCTEKITTSADWKNVYFSKGQIVNYNYASIVGENGQKKVWWETYTSKPSSSAVKSSYMKSLTVFNCKTREQQPLQMENYVDGKLAASFKEISLKTEIEPNTFSDMVFKEVCNKEQ